MAIKVTIKISGGETFVVEVETSITVLELKEKCVEKAGVGADKQRLIFKGRIVKDDETLESLKVEDGNTVHLVRSGVKPAAATTTSTGSQSTPSQVTTPAGTTGTTASSNPMGGFGFPPTSQFSPELMQQMMQGGFGGVGGLGGIPGMEDFNPQTAAALLNNPMVQEMMQQITNNPQLLKDIIGSNPLLQPMMVDYLHDNLTFSQEQNPIFNQMVNNPELLRNIMRPGMLQSGLQLHQSMQQQAAPGTAASPGANNVMNPLLGGAYPAFNFPADTRPPEERFAFQLQTLQEMGFTNRDENISVLNLTSGDISAAITRLLEARGNPPSG